MEDLKKEWEEFDEEFPEQFDDDSFSVNNKIIVGRGSYWEADREKVVEFIHQNFIPKSKVEKVAGEIRKDITNDGYKQAIEDYKNKLLG